MSSLAVRTKIKDFLDDNSGESIIDMTGDFEDLRVLLSENEIQYGAPWLGLQFIGDSELPNQLAATNDSGGYREIGSIVLHICSESRIGVGDSILARGETLRNLFRGENIEGIVIEGVAPVNFGPGSTLEFDGGYTSGSFRVEYHYDLNL